MPETVLSFLTHPDDAEILCGGTLARLAALGWRVHIATCTAGDCGATDKTPWEIAAIRTNENKAAAAVIGATYHCLGELDGFVCYDKPTMRKVYDLFRTIAPSLVLIHSPECYMMDHVQAAMMGRAASFLYGAPNISTLPLLAGSRIPHLYYCDTIEAIDPMGRPIQPTTLIDISKSMDRKEKMLACHASQREWLRAHHGMDEYIDAMKRQGELRGKAMGTKYAEGFVQHKGHAYPHNDLLQEILGQKEK